MHTNFSLLFKLIVICKTLLILLEKTLLILNLNILKTFFFERILKTYFDILKNKKIFNFVWTENPFFGGGGWWILLYNHFSWIQEKGYRGDGNRPPNIIPKSLTSQLVGRKNCHTKLENNYQSLNIKHKCYPPSP